MGKPDFTFTRFDLPVKLRLFIHIDSKMTHYPNNPHSKIYHWNWARDEFTPPLTKKLRERYIKDPQQYKKDFFTHLLLYKQFCSVLKKQVVCIKKLPYPHNISWLLTFLFLFQTAMDYHYYRFDMPLDLEEDPKSPLGWHYLRMEKIINGLVKKLQIPQKNQWIEEQMLYLLTKKGRDIIEQYIYDLSKPERRKLLSSYSAMQVYIQIQTEEEILSMGKHQDSIILKTGYAIWLELKRDIKGSAYHIRNYNELMRLFDGDPQCGTRTLLTSLNRFFPPKIVYRMKKHLYEWERGGLQ